MKLSNVVQCVCKVICLFIGLFTLCFSCSLIPQMLWQGSESILLITVSERFIFVCRRHTVQYRWLMYCIPQTKCWPLIYLPLCFVNSSHKSFHLCTKNKCGFWMCCYKPTWISQLHKHHNDITCRPESTGTCMCAVAQCTLWKWEEWGDKTIHV